MSVESAESEVRAAAPALPAGNPALLGLMTFLPSGVTLGLWFVGYLDTAKLGGGMIPIVSLSAGLFLLISAVWAGRLAQNTVAAIFGVFSAFWLSFGFLLIGLTSGWWAVDGDASGQVRSTYLLSFLLVFVLLTISTLRLPLITVWPGALKFARSTSQAAQTSASIASSAPSTAAMLLPSGL